MTRAKGKKQKVSTTTLLVHYQYEDNHETIEAEATFELPDELLPTAEEICDHDGLIEIHMDEWLIPQLADKHGVPVTAIDITGRSYA